MEKPAPADHPIQDLLARRWSPRSFADEAVPGKILVSLFEAARWAPSSFNEQPWFFLVAAKEDRAAFERMLACLMPANQAWAKGAPVLLLTAAKLAFERNAKPNRHALHDLGLAAMSLVVEATARGLFAHQMAGIETEKIRATYRLPEGVEPVTAIALGYPADAIPEESREREAAPRNRKALSEFVFADGWGKPASLLG
jgi:nitroreductase